MKEGLLGKYSPKVKKIGDIVSTVGKGLSGLQQNYWMGDPGVMGQSARQQKAQEAASGQQEIQNMLALMKLGESDHPSGVKEYEYAVKNGYKGSFEAWKKGPGRSGGGGSLFDFGDLGTSDPGVTQPPKTETNAPSYSPDQFEQDFPSPQNISGVWDKFKTRLTSKPKNSVSYNTPEELDSLVSSMSGDEFEKWLNN